MTNGITAAQRATGGLKRLRDGPWRDPSSYFTVPTRFRNFAFFAKNLVPAGHAGFLSNSKHPEMERL